MRKVLIALAIGTGIGIAAGSGAIAAPITAPTTGSPLSVQGLFTPVQYYGGYRYRYRYRPRCYYVRRCAGYYPYRRCWRERICR